MAGKLPLGLCNGTVSGLWNTDEIPIVTWNHNILRIRQSPPTFTPTNHERLMSASWTTCLIRHTPLTVLLPSGWDCQTVNGGMFLSTKLMQTTDSVTYTMLHRRVCHRHFPVHQNNTQDQKMNLFVWLKSETPKTLYEEFLSLVCSWLRITLT